MARELGAATELWSHTAEPSGGCARPRLLNHRYAHAKPSRNVRPIQEVGPRLYRPSSEKKCEHRQCIQYEVPEPASESRSKKTHCIDPGIRFWGLPWETFPPTLYLVIKDGKVKSGQFMCTTLKPMASALMAQKLGATPRTLQFPKLQRTTGLTPCANPVSACGICAGGGGASCKF